MVSWRMRAAPLRFALAHVNPSREALSGMRQRLRRAARSRYLVETTAVTPKRVAFG